MQRREIERPESGLDSGLFFLLIMSVAYIMVILCKLSGGNLARKGGERR
jgi:hypothetical protein